MGTASSAQDSGSAPMSAIDWLTESERAAVSTEQNKPETIDEPGVAESATQPEVTITDLDAQTADSVGLVLAAEMGLPGDLWRQSDPSRIAILIAAQENDSLPAIRGLLSRLLIAEARPPLTAGPEARVFFARVDKLIEMGALEQAAALLAQADQTDPEVLSRAFDVALLLGQEDSVCRAVLARPEAAPSEAAKVFCLARSGDWRAAALTLNSGRALGDISPELATLLELFLDPELAEETAAPALRGALSPLAFRLRDAIGEPVPTLGLPRAFAHADLRDTAGWRAQIDAAERLIRTGGIDPNTYLAILTQGVPSASGAIWDRAAALQDLQAALDSQDLAELNRTLPLAYAAAASVHGETALAYLFADQLAAFELRGPARDVQLRLSLLGDDPVSAAQTLPDTPRWAFIRAVAEGRPGALEAETPLELAIQGGFGPTTPGRLTRLTEDGKVGEGLLRAMSIFNTSARGDTAGLSEALAFFRSVGLEDISRRAALQLLILERPL